MSAYRHTQIGFLVIGILVAMIVFVAAIALAVERHPVVLVVLLMLGAALALFYSLTVEIVFADGPRIRVGTDEPNELFRALQPYVPYEGRR